MKIKLVSGSTRLENNKPIDSEAIIEIKDAKGLHHRELACLFMAAPDLMGACIGLLNRFVGLVNCGDCGNWNPEDEQEVKYARAAIAKATPQTEGVTP